MNTTIFPVLCENVDTHEMFVANNVNEIPDEVPVRILKTKLNKEICCCLLDDKFKIVHEFNRCDHCKGKVLSPFTAENVEKIFEVLQNKVSILEELVKKYEKQIKSLSVNSTD